MKLLFLFLIASIQIFPQETSFCHQKNLRLLSNKDKEDYFEEYNKSYQEKENVGRDSAVWRKLSGPYGGGISALKAKGDTLLAGTGPYEALIFYSTDRGVNWLQADFKKLGQVTDFLFLPWGGALATTTTEGEGGIEGGFIYKTEDLIHWRRTKTPVGYPTPYIEEYWSLGMDSDSILYAGANSSAIVYSTDKGEIWKPGFGDIDMGRTESFLLTDEGDLLAGTSNKILIKKKGAKPQEWVKTTYTNMPDESYSVYSISKGDSGKLYAQADYDTFVSTDNGYNWFVNPRNPNTLMYHSTYNKRFIAACPDGSGLFGSLAGYGIAVSDDDGFTWKWSNNGLPKKLGAWSTATEGQDTYFGASRGGVYKSTDYAESWYHSSKGISATLVNDFIIDSAGNFAAAGGGLGVSYSNDKGLTWNLSHKGLSNPYIWCITKDKDGIYFAGTPYGLFKSSDSMNSWIEIPQPQHINGDGSHYLKVDDQNRLYSLNNREGIYRTTDKGINWERLDESFLYHYSGGISFDGKGNIYAGTFGGLIYRSSDDGKTWENLRGVTGEHFAGPFLFSDDGVIYAKSTREGVLRSKDDGKTWELIMNGITTTRISGIALNKRTEELFASGYNGSVFYSTNGGDSWTDIRGNMKIGYIYKILIDKNEQVYVATRESIWKLESIILSTDGNNNNNIIKDYSLSQNYPNPFNPSTSIKYSIPEHSMVTIKVFDLLGREIRTLINKEKQTGSYEVTFNAEGLPSGIYFYSIHSGKFSETRKMLLVK